jgi:hypothetical protein
VHLRVHNIDRQCCVWGCTQPSRPELTRTPVVQPRQGWTAARATNAGDGEDKGGIKQEGQGAAKAQEKRGGGIK